MTKSRGGWAAVTFVMFAWGCGSDSGPPSDGQGGSSNAHTGGAAGASRGGTGGASGSGTGGASGTSSGASGDNSGAGGSTGSAANSGGSGGGTPVTTGDVFGPVHQGSYNNGPVDYSESVYHNACAPKEKYAPKFQELYGQYLGGIDNSLGGDGSLCDACALLTTRLGKSVLVHLVTYGVSKAPGDMDLSPAAYDAVYESDPMGTPAIPRPMSWQLAKCPASGNIYLQFQTMANPYWTSFWVRNGKLPIAKVESKAKSESGFSKLDRTSDGPFTDGNGVGTEGFDLRITSTDGQAITYTMSGFEAGAIVPTDVQFK